MSPIVHKAGNTKNQKECQGNITKHNLLLNIIRNKIINQTYSNELNHLVLA